MVIFIKKTDSKKDVAVALKKSNSKKRKSKLNEFYGKLPNVFGDGLEYQKKLRNEWE